MKVALVTGGSSGIGKAIVFSLASSSFNVAFTYNKNEEEALNIKNILQNKYHVSCYIEKVELSEKENIVNFIDNVISSFGRIDVLVNNAGVAKDMPFFLKQEEDFLNILKVNLVSSFIVSQKVAPYMLKEKKGVIINVASTNGIDTYYPESMDYDASKAGLISLTHNLAQELAPYIRVNAVLPGWIKTPMNKELDNNFEKSETKKIMLKRFGEPEEVANLVSFLVSDKASYINNTCIRVDGGYHA